MQGLQTMESKYRRILSKNLNEVRKAWFEWRSLMAIESVQHPFPTSSFFHLVHSAMFNDALGHLMKVLDRHKDSASFWYIYKQKGNTINELQKNKDRIETLKHLADSKRLKHIRDRTHFHIDKKAVVEPAQIWQDADISSKEIYSALLDLIIILQALAKDEFGNHFSMNFDVNEAKYLARIAMERE